MNSWNPLIVAVIFNPLWTLVMSPKGVVPLPALAEHLPREGAALPAVGVALLSLTQSLPGARPWGPLTPPTSWTAGWVLGNTGPSSPSLHIL